jgi:AcrR family transcriptional regulator
LTDDDLCRRDGPPEVVQRDRKSSLEDVRVRVPTRLRARRAEIEEAIFARVLRFGAPAAVASTDAEYMDGLRAAVVAAVEYFLAGVERPGEPSESIPSVAVKQARRAARAGVGLDTVLRRYIAGYALLEAYVIEEAEHEELLPQGALREVLATAAALVDRLIAAVTGAYREEIARTRHESTPTAKPPPPTGTQPAPDQNPEPSPRPQDGEGQADQARTERGVLGTRATENPEPSPRPQGGEGQADQARTERSVLGTRAREDAEMRRPSPSWRILQAVVEVIDERGFAGASVGLVIARAKVSRRTFYELFTGLEEALIAVMDKTLEQLSVRASQAFEEEGDWTDGMRAALAAGLAFFDSEPELARVTMIETLAAGPVVRVHLEHVAETFRRLVVARIESEVSHASPVAAESVLASVMGLIKARLIAREPEPLIELLGPLMGMTVTPLVMDEQRAAEEVRRGDELARTMQAAATARAQSTTAGVKQAAWLGTDAGQPAWLGVGASQELQAMLTNPRARRARECLRFLAEQGGRGSYPSNREIAAGIGITHQSQISKLLSELVGEGLAVKRSEGAGKRNAWRLTQRGEEIALALSERQDSSSAWIQVAEA